MPENYSAQATGGNVLERRTYLKYAKAEPDNAMRTDVAASSGGRTMDQVTANVGSGRAGVVALPAGAGQIIGRIVDAGGNALPGASVEMSASGVQRVAIADANGVFRLSGVPSGTVRLTATIAGFAPQQRVMEFNQQPVQADFALTVNGVTETVTVAAKEALSTPPSAGPVASAPPSQSVINLQRRASGVLPIRIDVPRAGTSHQFLKPLVVDVAPSVNLKYRRR